MIVVIVCAVKSNFVLEKRMKSQYTFFCSIMTLHQDHLLRKIGMSCDACRSFAFPAILEETLDKTSLSESAKKPSFFLELACLQAAPLEMLLSF